MTTAIKRSNVRYGILLFLFLATVFNYADRATLSVVAPIMSKELGFDPEAMGLAFSVLVFPTSLCKSPAAGCWINMVRGWSTAAR
jgi:sugar phosphate permease